MSKKRGHHEGGITKRKDGRWQGTVTIGKNDDGSQRRQYIYGKTRSEVAEKINKLINFVCIVCGLSISSSSNVQVSTKDGSHKLWFMQESYGISVWTTDSNDTNVDGISWKETQAITTDEIDALFV